ncbi:S-layer homology domain-containing protein [Anaeromicrobium sediminis]|uniref:SLH domain-containing protein n=1 Tax=Anaeromicrobium sediminis TaxID=1478221 RepID=A0A267MH20_9FIRM|nr:S-layer homology domain-containing protein [Anaeromicrobium sediminis]PAB58093.1 hypothetical protein CCE28_17310 [Anaeromicrobium sediminis]
MNKKIKILLLIISLLISTTFTSYGYIGVQGKIPRLTENNNTVVSSGSRMTEISKLKKDKSIEEIIEEIREAARRESEFMKEIGEDKDKNKDKDKKESKSKKSNKSTKSKSIEEIIREIQEAAREETEFMKEIGMDKKGSKSKSIEEIIEEIMEAAREETEFMKEIGEYKKGSKSEKNNRSTKSIEEIIREIQEGAREESRFMKEIEKEDNKPKKIFSDISSHWARDYIEKLSEKNIISGSNNNEFNPEGYITRAQIAAILVNALDIDMNSYENNKVFEDVGVESWYSKFVSVAYRNNLISGFDGEFKPEKEISGEELIQIVVNAYEKKYGEIKLDLDDMKNTNDVSDWAKVSVAKAKKIGAIDKLLDPIEYKGKVKRGQACVLVYELIK